jgi:hypothetical protein
MTRKKNGQVDGKIYPIIGGFDDIGLFTDQRFIGRRHQSLDEPVKQPLIQLQ